MQHRVEVRVERKDIIVELLSKELWRGKGLYSKTAEQFNRVGLIAHVTSRVGHQTVVGWRKAIGAEQVVRKPGIVATQIAQ